MVGKIICILITFLMLFTPSFALDTDKQIHIAASAVSAGFGVMLVDSLYPDAKPWQKWLGATAIGLLPGVVKEATDDHWDWEDMAANVVGAGFGAATILTVTWTW